MFDWQPIATAPKDGRTILGWCEQSQALHPIYWEGNEWRDHEECIGTEGKPTHWLEIPQPPGWIAEY